MLFGGKTFRVSSEEVILLFAKVWLNFLSHAMLWSCAYDFSDVCLTYLSLVFTPRSFSRSLTCHASENNLFNKFSIEIFERCTRADESFIESSFMVSSPALIEAEWKRKLLHRS